VVELTGIEPAADEDRFADQTSYSGNIANRSLSRSRTRAFSSGV
jgi:hypothetical protein